MLDFLAPIVAEPFHSLLSPELFPMIFSNQLVSWPIPVNLSLHPTSYKKKAIMKTSGRLKIGVNCFQSNMDFSQSHFFLFFYIYVNNNIICQSLQSWNLTTSFCSVSLNQSSIYYKKIKNGVLSWILNQINEWRIKHESTKHSMKEYLILLFLKIKCSTPAWVLYRLIWYFKLEKRFFVNL